MSDREQNPYIEYRDDMRRVVALLREAAKLDGRMKGRVPRGVKMRYRTDRVRARLTLAGAPLCVPVEDREILERETRFVHEVNDGIYLSPTLGYPRAEQIGTSYWLSKRAWQIETCGRSAVGVGLMRDVTRESPDKVYHATCKDRLCPACNARQQARAAPAIRRLIGDELSAGSRLWFMTLTVRHGKDDGLQSTRAVLDGAWGRLIRTKWFRETFGERLRCAEVEYTRDNGWHPHFHVLLKLDPGCKAWHWSHDRVERELQRLWRRSTEREGRVSWQVDLRELVARRDSISGEIESVRYWLRPNERKRYLRLARRGQVKLESRGANLYRVQGLDDVVSELVKYVTKRQADGLKPNQVSMWDWTPELVLEYSIGIRYWNLRRASKGWEQLLLEFREEEALLREIEEDEAGGYEYFPWAAIIHSCRRAGFHQLSDVEAEQFARDYPRILSALDVAGCDISADMIRGYILRFFGDTGAPLQRLRAKPWELSQWRDERTAAAIMDMQGAALQARYRARHWRVLLKLRRQHDRGVHYARVTGLGMSRRRTREVVEDLRRDGLIDELEVDGKARFELTVEGRRLLPSQLRDPAEKHRRRKAARDLQRALPGLMMQEEDVYG